MAKRSVLVRNDKRMVLIKKYEAKRDTLRKIIRDPSVSPEKKLEAQTEMQKLPRDSCKARYRNRCRITGRPRGVFRRFGLSRVVLRELSMNGDIPGVTKSSW